MKVLCLLLLTSYAFAANQIIVLISPPRSLSVGFLRMMQARGDFELFHEPSIAPFDAIYYKDFYHTAFRKDCFHSYEEITESILAVAENSPVFVKEMAFSLHHFFTADNPLMHQAQFVFLIRKPQDIILSYYRKGGIMPELICYKQSCEIFELILRCTNKAPCVLLSEDLGSYPEKSVSFFCERMGIPFIPQALTWDDLGPEFTGSEWRDGKTPEAVQYWHGGAIRSTCFMPLRTAAVDEKGEPTFAEIEKLEDRQICRELYQECLPYYMRLKEYAI